MSRRGLPAWRECLPRQVKKNHEILPCTFPASQDLPYLQSHLGHHLYELLVFTREFYWFSYRGSVPALRQVIDFPSCLSGDTWLWAEGRAEWFVGGSVHRQMRAGVAPSCFIARADRHGGERGAEKTLPLPLLPSECLSQATGTQSSWP